MRLRHTYNALVTRAETNRLVYHPRVSLLSSISNIPHLPLSPYPPYPPYPPTTKNLFGIPGFLTHRDAWAGSFHELLTLDTPRTDAPMHLPEPPAQHAVRERRRLRRLFEEEMAAGEPAFYLYPSSPSPFPTFPHSHLPSFSPFLIPSLPPSLPSSFPALLDEEASVAARKGRRLAPPSPRHCSANIGPTAVCASQTGITTKQVRYTVHG